LDRVKFYIDMFNDFAKANPGTQFWMTRVGCGLAGYENSDIAPLFRNLPNINWPEEWADLIE